jgi:hypothetical protein
MLKGSPYTTFHPMMTSSSFDFRVYLKNIFALEPLLKLATFVVEEVIYQNVKKKGKKIIYIYIYLQHNGLGFFTGFLFKKRYTETIFVWRLICLWCRGRDLHGLQSSSGLCSSPVRHVL